MTTNPQFSASRTAPHSLEAEEYLLACCLLDGADIVARCLAAKIKPESFYLSTHGLVYETLLALYAENRAIDVCVLAEALKSSKQLDAVGGFAFIAQVSTRIPTTAQAGFFIEKVVELSTLRAIIRAATGAVEECYSFTGGIEEFSAEVQQRIQAATAMHLVTPSKTWPVALQEARAQAAAMISGKDDGVVSLGLKDLDDAFAKARRGELVVLAARPSIGKSSKMRAMALKTAKAGFVTQVHTLEVPSRDVGLQMASSISGISLRGLHQAHPKDQQDFYAALDGLNIPSLHVFDNDRSISAIISRARAIKPDAIYIDYLGLIDDCQPRKGETMAQAVGRVTKALKQIAIELNCVVVLLCQLNRSSATENREPRLDDLRDSGDIEQDADRVIFLHLPATNPITNQPQKSTDDPVSSPTFYVNAIQAKGRNVGTGIVGILFKRAVATFFQLDRASQPRS